MSGKRKHSWRGKKAEKEYERLKQEVAKEEAKVRSESEDRREKIKVRWKECKGLPKRRDYDELLDELEPLTNKYGFDLSDRLRSLHQLAELQDQEIEYLTKFRCDWERIQAYAPDLLKSLSFQSLLARLQRFGETLTEEETPKQKQERRRRGYTRRGGVGRIEYEFGGMEEADRLNKPWPSWPFALGDLPYEPKCLDHIFARGEIHMDDSEGEMPIFRCPILKLGLQSLFGIDKNRFPKDLPRRETGRETLYDWHAVVKIMKALLSEESTMRKEGARGGSQRTLWPSDPNRRVRVLQGIKERMNNISVPKDVKSAFLMVICPYLPDSAK